VARAKKTDRAEARRRARASAASSAAATASTSPAEGAKPGPSQPAPAGRPSLTGALRESIRPVTLRDDIRDIPWLITRTNAVWLPSVLVVASTVWFGASGGTLRDLPGIAFNLFVFPPPLAAAFLAGLLTQRMSYMAGLLVGIVAALVFSVYVLFGPVAGGQLTAADRQNYVLYAIAVSPISGLAIGGFAGFYRRFLRRANPNAGRRQQPPRSKSTTKAPARR
jgi:hypothetical protein